MPAWLRSLDIHSSSLRSGNFWSSVLTSRDLIVVEPEFFCFEAYNPQRLVRQFELVQLLAIPYFLTHNDPWILRGRFAKGKSLQSKTLSLTFISITPWKWITKLFEDSICGGIMYSQITQNVMFLWRTLIINSS